MASIETIRELARRFTADQLEQCLNEEIAVGENACDQEGPADEVVGTLAEAEFVRQQVEDGVPVKDAVRELARRIRAVQHGFIASTELGGDRPGPVEPQNLG
jgi:hypothetical protein